MIPKTSLMVLAVIGVVLVSGSMVCVAAQNSPPPDVHAIASADNAFTLDFYAQLKTQPGNLFFSPWSISTALSMANAGAAGNTQSQMAQTLHLGKLDPQTVGPEVGELQGMLQPPDKEHPAYQLSTANALWIKQGYKLEPNYVHSMATDFDGTLNQLDFADSPAAAKTINDWVAKKTNDKITNLLPSGPLNAATRLVLTNAVYFPRAIGGMRLIKLSTSG